MTQTNFPWSRSEHYQYDADNNLTSKTDRKGQTITYLYDSSPYIGVSPQSAQPYPCGFLRNGLFLKARRFPSKDMHVNSSYILY